RVRPGPLHPLQRHHPLRHPLPPLLPGPDAGIHGAPPALSLGLAGRRRLPAVGRRPGHRRLRGPHRDPGQLHHRGRKPMSASTTFYDRDGNVISEEAWQAKWYDDDYRLLSRTAIGDWEVLAWWTGVNERGKE